MRSVFSTWYLFSVPEVPKKIRKTTWDRDYGPAFDSFQTTFMLSIPFWQT
jgi:hypothetical protein